MGARTALHRAYGLAVALDYAWGLVRFYAHGGWRTPLGHGWGLLVQVALTALCALIASLIYRERRWAVWLYTVVNGLVTFGMLLFFLEGVPQRFVGVSAPALFVLGCATLATGGGDDERRREKPLR